MAAVTQRAVRQGKYRLVDQGRHGTVNLDVKQSGGESWRLFLCWPRLSIRFLEQHLPSSHTHTHTHTHTHFAHHQRLAQQSAATLTRYFLRFLLVSLWCSGAGHIVFFQLFMFVFSVQQCLFFFPFFFFLLFAPPFSEEDCFLPVWMKSQELNPKTQGA